MIIRRVFFLNYLGAVLAVATAVAGSLGSLRQAQAQNLNEQTQISITAPLEGPLAGPQSPQTAASPMQAVTLQAVQGSERKTNNCGRSPDQLQLAVNNIRAMSQREKETLRAGLHTKAKLDEVADVQAFLAQNPGKEAEFCIQALGPPAPTLNAPNGQPTKVKVSFMGNPTYETNALKAGNNNSIDLSAGVGSSALVTTAGLRPLDLVALSATEGSSRYSRFFSQNTDAVNSYIAYSAFLHADGYYIMPNGQVKFVPFVDPNQRSVEVPEQNMATIDTLAFGFQNQTSFTPTFHTEKADFFTPQFTLSSQNINLDDKAYTQECANTLKAFCHYANLSLTVGQSFSDVTPQQNFNVAGSAAVGWRINKEWGIALQGTATGKEYENFVGGRRDLQLQAGSVLTYAPTTQFKITKAEYASVSFTLPVTYYRNFSTVSAAAWSGLVIQPTLTIAFNYTADPATMPPK